MAKFCEFCLHLIVFLLPQCLILARWNTDDYMKREHTLVKPYQGGGTNMPLWDFVGSTMVTTKYIRLTSDHQSKRGGLWNSVPCLVHNWELHVHFKVHGSGSSLFGDGFAIWYIKERGQSGDVFGSQDSFHGLGIFADTYSNHNGPHNHGHPYISAMVGNGTTTYDHDRDGTHTEIAGCEAQFRNKPHETYLAIRYEDYTLTVSMDIDGKNAWKKCFEVKGVRLPTGYYFGASAATGQLADNHDIISMKLYQLQSDFEQTKDGQEKEDYSKISPGADFFAPPRDHLEDPKGGYMSGGGGLSGWKLLVLIIIIVIGLGICAMVGFVIYVKRQEDNRKRFY